MYGEDGSWTSVERVKPADQAEWTNLKLLGIQKGSGQLTISRPRSGRVPFWARRAMLVVNILARSRAADAESVSTVVAALETHKVEAALKQGEPSLLTSWPTWGSGWLSQF